MIKMARKDDKKEEKAPAAKGAPAGAKAAAPVKGAVPAPAVKGAPAAKGAKGVPVPEPPVEEKKEKPKKEKISQKDRPNSKKKHAKVQVWKLYEIKDGKAVRKRENCPRCGSGTFLASYKNRKYCGKCGYGQITSLPNITK